MDCHKSRWMNVGRENEKGLTIIELSIVVSIILILASALILPGVRRFLNAAREKEAVAELQAMKSVMDTYYANYGILPSGPYGNPVSRTGPLPHPHIGEVLREKGINWDDDSFNGLLDPWGKSYVYRTDMWHPGHPGTRQRYIIFSKGPDKLEENRDDIYITENRFTSKDLTNIKTDFGFTYMGGPHEVYEAYSNRQGALDSTVD
ncbi:MAG: prepilin-type N-terminal cleavage/methylation domain-containing protein [Bacillota bacterium]